MPLKPFRIDDVDGWSRLQEERLFDHQYIKVDEVEYQTPNRPDTVKWTIARRKSGVCIAPMLSDGRLLMIQQERYPIQRVLWEFPAGQIDQAGWREDAQLIIDAAERELEEETGHQLVSDGDLIPLGHFFCSQGFTDEHVYLFLAETVEPTGRGLQLDPSENILDCRPFTPQEIREKVAQNEIVDANSLAIFARLCARGNFG